MTGEDILPAAPACSELLEPALRADSQVAVPGLDWTVSKTVAHGARGPLWYAFDLWSGPADDTAFDLVVKLDASNEALLCSFGNAALVCATSLDKAQPRGGGTSRPARRTRAALPPWPVTSSSSMGATPDGASGSTSPLPPGWRPGSGQRLSRAGGAAEPARLGVACRPAFGVGRRPLGFAA